MLFAWIRRNKQHKKQLRELLDTLSPILPRIVKVDQLMDRAYPFLREMIDDSDDANMQAYCEARRKAISQDCSDPRKSVELLDMAT